MLTPENTVDGQPHPSDGDGAHLGLVTHRTNKLKGYGAVLN